MACGCYPLAPSKYVISNRNAAEGSPFGTLLPLFDRMRASGNAPFPQALAPDEGQASAAAQSARSALLRSWKAAGAPQPSCVVAAWLSGPYV